MMMRELVPALISVFLDNEELIREKIMESEEKFGLLHFSWYLPNGDVLEFGKRDFLEFLKYKDLYTSPLYKALL